MAYLNEQVQKKPKLRALEKQFNEEPEYDEAVLFRSIQQGKNSVQILTFEQDLKDEKIDSEPDMDIEHLDDRLQPGIHEPRVSGRGAGGTLADNGLLAGFPARPARTMDSATEVCSEKI